jgi:hypothetical protein
MRPLCRKKRIKETEQKLRFSRNTLGHVFIIQLFLEVTLPLVPLLQFQVRGSLWRTGRGRDAGVSEYILQSFSRVEGKIHDLCIVYKTGVRRGAGGGEHLKSKQFVNYEQLRC